MLYTTAKIASKEYKLRLSAQNCADVEKRIGKSVLDVLLAMAPDTVSADSNSIGIKGTSMPHVDDICTILHGAMQKFQHGISLNDVYDLYDDHIDQGGTYNDFVGYINDTLVVSGFLAKEAAPENQTTEATAPVA